MPHRALSGVEAELELAWSGLAGLLDGLLDGIDQLPPARLGVRAALAIEGVDEAVEPFAIALATRDLLVDAAEDAPMVVFVDDLPWVDAPTRRTLSYIARRLQFERWRSSRPAAPGTDAHTDTGPSVVLDAVTDDVADAILARRRRDERQVRRELVAAGGGIPLVLVEAANMLDADQRTGPGRPPRPAADRRRPASGSSTCCSSASRRPCCRRCWSPPPSPTATSCGS